jgi:hypothetical protein
MRRIKNNAGEHKKGTGYFVDEAKKLKKFGEQAVMGEKRLDPLPRRM